VETCPPTLIGGLLASTCEVQRTKVISVDLHKVNRTRLFQGNEKDTISDVWSEGQRVEPTLST